MKDVANPQVTVLMAVYNGGEKISATIESVLSQTYKEYEFIIVDDSSMDNTLDIVKSYKDKRIRILKNDANIGQTKSLNIGLQAAEGEYIARMDVDDYSMPNRLEKQYNYIISHPEFSVVGTDCLVIDEFNRKKGISRGFSIYEDIVLKSLTGSPINHVSVLMKKKDIMDIGGYCGTYKISADYDLWSRLIRSGYKITTLNEVLCLYRASEASYSNINKLIKCDENANIIYENIRYFSDFIIDKDIAKQIVNLFSDEILNMSRGKIVKIENIYKNILAQLKPQFCFKVETNQVKRNLMKNYWMAAYHCMITNRTNKARNIIQMCCRNHGINLPSIIIYILSYINNIKALRMINYIRSKHVSL